MNQAAKIKVGSSNGFDVDTVRDDFPILSQTVHDKPLIYFDNAASAQKPRVVIDNIAYTMTSEYANVHRGLHHMSNAATTKYEGARRIAQRFLNAKSENEIVFTSGATDAINLVADAYGGDFIGEGDEIILSVLEHHSNIVPWHYMRERKGAVLKWVDITDEGDLDLEAFEKLFTSRTKMVAITHASNVTGTIIPAKEIVRIAHGYGVPVLLDGCQAVLHSKVDVEDLDVDFYVFSGHKIYGPTGVGVLYGKADWLTKLRPYRGGGSMIEEVKRELITYADPPQRFEAGTPPIVEAIALGAALDYFTRFDCSKVFAHEHDLLTYATECVQEINALRVIGTSNHKASILSFVMDGAHPHDVSTIIDRSGIAIRAGHHCAQPLMNRYGVTSTARVSFAMYNTRDEVDRFVEALFKAREFLS